MNSLKLDFMCRVCLEEGSIFNWNNEIIDFSGTSYKDCYYKYTKLEENDTDHYPENLCQLCASELKNTYFLIEKALESFRKLQALLKTKSFNLDVPTNQSLDKNSLDVICSVDDALLEHFSNEATISESKDINFSEEMTDKIKADNKNSSSAIYIDLESTEQILTIESMDQIISGSESEINTLKEEPKIESILIESEHFKNIENNDSFDEPLLDTEILSLANKEFRKKHLSLQTFPEKKQRYNSGKKPKSVSNYQAKNILKKNELSLNNSLNRNVNEQAETLTENISVSNQTKKKKKYISICQYCSLETVGPSQLKRHEATHNVNRERPHVCTKCGLKLYTLSTLKSHMKTHEENRQKTRKCEFCEKEFFSTGSLNVHRRRHLGVVFKCKMCSKEYYRQIDLDKHVLKHSAPPGQTYFGERKYVVQCQYCNKSVMTNKWKGHEAEHLGKPQVKCKVCNKDFFSRRRCTKHLRQVHQKTASDYDDLIHYYEKRTDARLTSLLLKQQLNVKPLME